MTDPITRDMDAVAAEVRRCAYAWESDTRVVGNVTAGELRALMREHDEARAEVARLTADGAYVLLGDAAQAIADLRRERDEALAVSYPRVLRAAAHVVDRETRVVTDVVLNDIADAILALTPDDIDRLTKEHEHD